MQIPPETTSPSNSRPMRGVDNEGAAMQRRADLLGRMRHSLRRRQLLRRGLAVLAVIVLATTVSRARSAGEQAAQQWNPDRSVWVVQTPLAAGTEIAESHIASRPAPAALTPGDAAIESPLGSRVTVSHMPGEILRDGRIAGRDDNAVSSLVEPGHSAVTVDVDSDVFVVGDRVGLHSLLSGREVASGMVVAVHEGAVTVGVASPAPLIAELGRGGVIVSLAGP